jgi:ribose transport system permease protein
MVIVAARRMARQYGARIALLVVVWVAMALFIPEFRGTSSFFAVLNNLPLLGLIALGLTATIVAGELDLAITSIAAIGGVVAVQMSGSGVVIALLVGTAAGLAAGTAQGWLIGRIGINSLVFTIGSLIVFRGLAYVLADENPVSITNLNVTNIFLHRYWIFSFSSLVAIGIFIIVGLFLTFAYLGRELYAIGGGRHEAVAMGIPVVRPVTIAFAISGTCAGLAGGLAAMNGGAADPAAFLNELLYGVAAALLGGISLYGGRGTVINTLLGVLLLGVITSALTARGDSQAASDIVTGITLMVVIAATAIGGATGKLSLRGGSTARNLFNRGSSGDGSATANTS